MCVLLTTGSLAWEKLSTKAGSHFDNKTLSDLSQFPSDWPEIELLSTAVATGPTNDTANYNSFLVALVAPVSRGNVTISSADIKDPPVINPNWYSSTTDQQIAIQAFKRLREWANASDVTVGPEFIPGPFIETDAQILAAIKATSGTIYHASATCKSIPATFPPRVSLVDLELTHLHRSNGSSK